MVFRVLKKSLTAMTERVGESSESSDDNSASYDVLPGESITSCNRLLRENEQGPAHKHPFSFTFSKADWPSMRSHSTARNDFN